MSRPELRFIVLENTGDERGSSFSTGTGWIKFLGEIDDAHITTLLPGCVRGNHYHTRRNEVLMVLSTDEWQLNWDQGTDTTVSTKHFDSGVVIIEVDTLASHAVANIGRSPLWILGLSNEIWDPRSPDAYVRKVSPIP